MAAIKHFTITDHETERRVELTTGDDGPELMIGTADDCQWIAMNPKRALALAALLTAWAKEKEQNAIKAPPP